MAALPGLTAHGVPAGLHTLVTLPSDGPAEDRLLTRCADHGLALRGLTELHHDPAGRPQGLLIGFAAPSERACPAAFDALFTVLTSFAALTSDRSGGAPTGAGTAAGPTRPRPHRDPSAQ
ncbi:hypothetical protein [Streptosporangium vulgare]|uniref:Uncharacterized protein n=1 Tax=Streptosporangium vulgare TaxID=46190 RepID=A0ABV5T4V2_9ACTN